MAGLDRRQRPLLGRDLTVNSFGTLDLLKTISSHPGLKASRDNRWHYLGLVNEPCFDKADRPRSRTLRPVARQARAPTARPIPSTNAAEISRSEDRRARQDRAGRLVLRLGTGIVGLRLFPNPDFDEAAAKKWDPSATTPIPATTCDKRPGAALPRRHVLRVLPRRAEPDQAAGRSGEPEVGEPELERRRAVLLDRPHLRLGGEPERASCSSSSTPRGPARSTPRWSPPTTSTIRAR